MESLVKNSGTPERMGLAGLGAVRAWRQDRAVVRLFTSWSTVRLVPTIRRLTHLLPPHLVVI